MNSSRRETLQLAGAGLAASVLSFGGPLRAQVKEEAENEPVTITRKSIDRYLEVINVDLLEQQATGAGRMKLPDFEHDEFIPLSSAAAAPANPMS